MGKASAKTSIGLRPRLYWQMFRLIERLSDLRGNQAAGHLEVNLPQTPTPALWVFVSTIGELTAIDPFLRALLAETPKTLQLVLITDHPHYRSSYEARLPEAVICVTRGHGRDASTLATHYPPQLLIVAEIPCLPSDAPCRFSFAFLLEAKRHGSAACIVNGWLYHYRPACRMDSIERKLFQRAALCAYDAIGVQTDQVRTDLIAAGAPPDRIRVTGNIKFDAMNRPDWSPAQARSPELLGALLDTARPVIVAGCVTDYTEQCIVLDAFMRLRATTPNALLVLAPRHPEVAEHMHKLREFLRERCLTFRFRSEIEDVALHTDIACLVLDTMGELRDFYAAAAIAHVGVDHNVLEPLSFDKPVTVCPGWDKTYPSYPVYLVLRDEQALIEIHNAEEMLEQWAILLTTSAIERPVSPLEKLAELRGATQRNLALCLPLINGKFR